MSQQHGKRDSGPCQDNTDDTAELGHTKAGQCTDGHQLNGHESLTEADDDQVIYRNPKGFRIMEKQSGDRAWEQHKEAKPSAVFQETDSICPPTRWTAMAAAPKAETILVSTMEIIQ